MRHYGPDANDRAQRTLSKHDDDRANVGEGEMDGHLNECGTTSFTDTRAWGVFWRWVESGGGELRVKKMIPLVLATEWKENPH